MILQVLARYYDALLKEGKLDKPGWQKERVSWELQIDEDGQLMRVSPLQSVETRGKKEVSVPQTLTIPAHEGRASGIKPYFLCDNSTYFLGVDNKGKPKRSRECFEACGKAHAELLGRVEHPAAKALLRYFEKRDPEKFADHPALSEYREEIMAGGNIIFSFGKLAERMQDIPALRAAWDAFYADETADGERMRCLVSGEIKPIARLHLPIKGVAGGQPMGTSLVSFNAPAYESFGHDGQQGLNAPVGQDAAFAYVAALNYLLSQRNHFTRLGDSTIVYWAEDADDAYAGCFQYLMEGNATVDDRDLENVMRNLANGRNAQWDDFPLCPDNRFFILALSPNAARLSVRFFLQDTFGNIAANLIRHHERLKIMKPSFDPREYLSVWALLDETVNHKSRDKNTSPLLAGAAMRSILQDLPYPELLYNGVELRIRAEHEITRGRAAIIKAYLLKNAASDAAYSEIKEALQVELNEQTTYTPYVLGRLFSVLEDLQHAANPDITTTIRDRYFNSACATPMLVFPRLISLSNSHLKKLDTGKQISFSRKITDLLGRINEEYPSRLNLREQGVFQIGYYHQTQIRYTKKEEKKNV